eukprot:CAMPEP_0184274284 /NCGR_PEP_ID=MMETSP0977-20130417/45143_1 /TAXON_ID=483370 /ORGANISM="non described non described, Strain CCMP2097" /LENGTH=41 /DNA_ID= /DNA_START= /DNA_END= /DNA_ORIENTATION=
MTVGFRRPRRAGRRQAAAAARRGPEYSLQTPGDAADGPLSS